MPTGKIMKMRRSAMTGKDYGTVRDDKSGKEYPFEAPPNMFQIFERVMFEVEPPSERMLGSAKPRVNAILAKL